MPMFLTSLSFAGLADWLQRQNAAGPLVWITNAGRRLDDGDDLLAMVQRELTAQRLEATRVDVRADGPDALRPASAILMSGGDPFRLLADLRASGADRLLREAHERGVPLAGQSAGAMVCGPSLEPAAVTSPFPPPPGLDLQGLALTRHAILPHHDGPGRAELHRQAALAFRDRWPLTALWDDEALLIEDDGRTRIRRQHGDQVAYSQLVSVGGHRFVVAEDPAGLLGFVYYRQAIPEPGRTPIGEVDLLHAYPRGRASATDQRLLRRATWNLLCEGFDEALLSADPEHPEQVIDLIREAGEP